MRPYTCRRHFARIPKVVIEQQLAAVITRPSLPFVVLDNSRLSSTRTAFAHHYATGKITIVEHCCTTCTTMVQNLANLPRALAERVEVLPGSLGKLAMAGGLPQHANFFFDLEAVTDAKSDDVLHWIATTKGEGCIGWPTRHRRGETTAQIVRVINRKINNRISRVSGYTRPKGATMVYCFVQSEPCSPADIEYDVAWVRIVGGRWVDVKWVGYPKPTRYTLDVEAAFVQTGKATARVQLPGNSAWVDAALRE